MDITPRPGHTSPGAVHQIKLVVGVYCVATGLYLACERTERLWSTLFV